MEIDGSDWSLVCIIRLNHLLGPKVIDFDFFVVRAGGQTVPQLMESHGMDDTTMFTVLLDLLFCLDVPDYHAFIVTGGQIDRSW